MSNIRHPNFFSKDVALDSLDLCCQFSATDTIFTVNGVLMGLPDGWPHPLSVMGEPILTLVTNKGGHC